MNEKKVDAKKKDGKTGSKKGVSRRNFLTAAAAGAAALGFPMVAKAQGPITMRWQSTWPTKDIFHEYALDYAKKVNDMTGGDLKIEVLPAGAVVPAFGLLDAVSKGTLDAATACSSTTTASRMRWRCGDRAPLSAWMPTCCCPGTSTAAARSCWQRSMSPSAPTWCPLLTADDDPAARLVQEADQQGGGLQGHEVPHRGHFIDLFNGLGAAVNALPGGEIVPALDRGLLDGAEFNNATSDRLLGFPDVSKVCMLQSYHQNAESFEILFNKTKYDALPTR